MNMLNIIQIFEIEVTEEAKILKAIQIQILTVILTFKKQSLFLL